MYSKAVSPYTAEDTSAVLSTNIYEMQHDILAEDLSGNPLMKKTKNEMTSAKLITTNQRVVGAVNELVKNQENLSVITKNALQTMYNILGDTLLNEDLKERLQQIAPTVIEAVLLLNERAEEEKDFIKDDYEDVFLVGEETSHVFCLSHRPIGKIRLYIDGLRYFSNTYTYSREKNAVEWIFTADNGGFDIEDSEVVIEYDYKREKEDRNCEET